MDSTQLYSYHLLKGRAREVNHVIECEHLPKALDGSEHTGVAGRLRSIHTHRAWHYRTTSSWAKPIAACSAFGGIRSRGRSCVVRPASYAAAIRPRAVDADSLG